MHWKAWWKKSRVEGGEGVRQMEGFVQTGDENTAHLGTRFTDLQKWLVNGEQRENR